MMTTNPWYEIVPAVAPLTQGDLLMDCPLVCWRDEAPDYGAEQGSEPPTAPFVAWRRQNVIVLTQACDLEHGKVRHVVLGVHAALVDYRKTWEEWMRGHGHNPSEKAWRRACEDIAAGYIWNLTFLDQFHHADVSTGVRVVDFHQIFTAPRTLLEAQLRHAGRPRLRLLAPYVEYLAQAFARYFMRVGLPQPVTPEWEVKSP